MPSKRKRYHDRRHNSRDQSTASHAKRRRLSDEARDDGSKAQKVSTEPVQSVVQTNDEGWTVVKNRGSKPHSSDLNQHDRTYPQLRIHQNYQSEIRLKDLRDLGLYLLADETAPKWTAIANSNNVRKVVTVMVPGLDEKLLKRAEKLFRSNEGATNDTLEDSHEAPAPKGDQPKPPTVVQGEGNEVHAHEPVTKNEKFPSWLFDHVLQVKGPGDAKMSKVHSPLQALLLSQEVDKSNPTRSGHTAERTPIANFVHSADDLRDAEFPIHPASFTIKLDAELEAARRQQTGQSLGHGWVDSNVASPQLRTNAASRDFVSEGLSIYSVDCEMVQTSDDKNSLARVSVISYPNGDVVLDKYVMPELPITNYFTQFSGITPEILADVTTTLKDVQEELMKLLTPTSILLGHSLDSDLNALKLTHPFLIDTSLIYPHPRGLPLRSSLKFLANKYLKREIQTGGANGHNSVEDAQAVLDLVKLKCEKGPKWGTIEANGEPIFRRLKRNGRTSAMVEYGTPERGFGKDATHTIGCQDDGEIAKGIVRAIKGDNFFDFEIAAGGVDYVWGRFRALEFARGWVNGTAAPPVKADGADHGTESTQNGIDAASEEAEKLDLLALETVRRLQEVYEALPPKSLLVVCSGTSDIRPVMQLQAQQQQYRKEFKIKKWDELSIKWTDVEEQALRKACDDARAGWGVCTIK